jgi:hypothetical protein
MKKILGLIAAAGLISSAANTLASEGEVELASLMGTMQKFAHKVALSLDAENKKLVGFYVHELEEVIEEVEEVESYDGHKVGKLTEKLLVPALERFEDAYKSGDWVAANQQFDVMIKTCNQCHDTTDHGYIKIERSSVNPFMQSFK